MTVRAVAHEVSAFLAPVLLSVLAAAMLVVLSPGYGIDENAMDPRYSSVSHRTAVPAGASGCYAYAAALFRGDLGVSTGFGVPVVDLLRERVGVTARNVMLGLAGAWAAAISFSMWGLCTSGRAFRALTTTAGSLVLCVPSALIALAAALVGGGPGAAVAVVVFPRLYRYCDNLMQQAAKQPHVAAARARGVSGSRRFSSCVVPAILPGMLALSAVSINLAIGAAIPIEVLSDAAGLGQLAWRAALSRDLPLVAGATLCIAITSIAANRVARVLAAISERRT